MRPPTLATMVELYGSSMGLALEARRFLRQMEQLKRLALNAELLAVRVADGGEVFQTLAKEVGRMASQANQLIQSLHGHAVEVAARAIRSAALGRLCEKYELAVALGTRGRTLDLVEARRGDVGGAMIADLQVIERALRKADGRLSELSRLNVELPMIATLLNIEANRDANRDPALTSAARSLVALKSELAALLERIQSRTHQTLGLLAGIA